jgi:DtxR family Mn-dependent transcriptional regulator
MKLSENAQEQLEYLWTSQEEHDAAELPPSIDYAELVGLDFVELYQSQPRLTEAGLSEAANAIRRHRLAERLMVDVLVTSEEQVDAHACSLEHALVDGIEESICTLLGHPRACPHGKPIPPGKCCKQMRSTVERLIAPLCELRPGQEGQIAYLHMHDPQHLQKLMAMGVLPGVAMKLKSNFPSYVFEAGFSQFAVDETIAADIFVRLG